MKRQYIPVYAAGLGLLVIGALAAGVPASALLFLAVVLACPTMMLFMHGGHGGHSGPATSDEHAEHRGHDHGDGSGVIEPADVTSGPRR